MCGITSEILRPVTLARIMLLKLAKTWGEVGLGAQFATSSNTHIYVDARYEQSLSGTKHQGYKGSIGIKYSW